jgi:Icc-related predicted phosphoesterase
MAELLNEHEERDGVRARSRPRHYAVGDCQVGIAGTKGFVGGFRGLGLPDFGASSLRAVYAETTEEAETLARGLNEIAVCPFRIALLHYAPTAETLHGEPVEIWTFLVSDRLAAPIPEHRPDLVLHGHAHAGAFEASLEGCPSLTSRFPSWGATSGSSS